MKNFIIFAVFGSVGFFLLKPKQGNLNGLGRVNNNEVETFLNNFNAKKSFFGLRFWNTAKNYKLLTDTNITTSERLTAIENIKVSEFHKIIKDSSSFDLFVFKKKVGKHNVYIKLSLGENSKPVECSSQ